MLSEHNKHNISELIKKVAEGPSTEELLLFFADNSGMVESSKSYLRICEQNNSEILQWLTYQFTVHQVTQQQFNSDIAPIIALFSSESDKNAYSTLGISPEASIEEIKKAYRELSRRYHPDTTTASKEEAASQFIAVSTAYRKIMTDRENRTPNSSSAAPSWKYKGNDSHKSKGRKNTVIIISFLCIGLLFITLIAPSLYRTHLLFNLGNVSSIGNTTENDPDIKPVKNVAVMTSTSSDTSVTITDYPASPNLPSKTVLTKPTNLQQMQLRTDSISSPAGSPNISPDNTTSPKSVKTNSETNQISDQVSRTDLEKPITKKRQIIVLAEAHLPSSNLTAGKFSDRIQPTPENILITTQKPEPLVSQVQHIPTSHNDSSNTGEQSSKFQKTDLPSQNSNKYNSKKILPNQSGLLPSSQESPIHSPNPTNLQQEKMVTLEESTSLQKNITQIDPSEISKKTTRPSVLETIHQKVIENTKPRKILFLSSTEQQVKNLAPRTESISSIEESKEKTEINNQRGENKGHKQEKPNQKNERIVPQQTEITEIPKKSALEKSPAADFNARQAIEALIHNYTLFYNNKDLAGLSKLFEPQAMENKKYFTDCSADYIQLFQSVQSLFLTIQITNWEENGNQTKIKGDFRITLNYPDQKVAHSTGHISLFLNKHGKIYKIKNLAYTFSNNL